MCRFSCLVVLFCSLVLVGDELILGDFEQSQWAGVVRDTELVKVGTASGKWADPMMSPTLRVPDIPTDWSAYNRLVFWMHSAKANNQRLTLVCNSENPANGTRKWDYYYYHFTVDWEGWRKFDLVFDRDIRGTRNPVGWHQISYCTINAGGWQHTPKPDTRLHLDDVKLIRDVAHLEARLMAVADAARQPWRLTLTNQGNGPHAFLLSTVSPDKSPYCITDLPERTPPVEPGKSWCTTVFLTCPGVSSLPPLERTEFSIVAKAADLHESEPARALIATVQPLAERRHPFLLGGKDIYRRALARAERFPWAKEQVDVQIRKADQALKGDVSLPDKGGQWSHHYVCKEKCGTSLTYEDGKHICKRCGRVYTGWPYDEVIVARCHGRYWRNLRELGLAYAFTGKEAYAERAREILLEYAAKYKHYPLHNNRGGKSRSAARVFAQTLDEAVAIIGVCWGYDLVYNAPCFRAADHQVIGDEFLREVAATIRRNQGGIGNWQSWHNAGLAAIGFCLRDPDLAWAALKQKRGGFEYQLANSILPDGFWHEGTAAYHYYALSALQWTAEIAHFAGIDYWSDPRLQSLYDAPLQYTFPDLSFPAVNDSDVFSIRGRHSTYELAYTRTGKPSYLTVAQTGERRSLHALLWGPDELPPAPSTSLPSRDFRGLGAVVLRQGTGADQLYLHLDYGAHGGGHGHPDKLALILFGLGRQLAPDPARLAYGAPLHGSWYRQTFAHNTVCVDERSQAATTGVLEQAHFSEQLAFAQASSDGAYPGVSMRRRVAVFDGVVLDVFELSAPEVHCYDYLYHNFGSLVPDLRTVPRAEPVGSNAGYQHCRDVRAGTAEGDWHAVFELPDAKVHFTMLGAPGTDLFFGTGMANNPPVPCPMIIARRRASETRYAVLLEPYRERPAVTAFRQVPDAEQALVFEIMRGEERTRLSIADRPGGGPDDKPANVPPVTLFRETAVGQRRDTRSGKDGER